MFKQTKLIIKTILFSIVYFLSNLGNIFSDTSLKDEILIKDVTVGSSTTKPLQAYTGSAESTTIETLIFSSAEQIMIRVYVVFVVGVLIYIGYLFLTAEGKTDQYTNAWKAVVYVVVGVTVIPLAYIIIKIVTGIDI